MAHAWTLLGNLIDQGCEADVIAHRDILSMIDDVDNLLKMQPGIDGVADRAKS
ncbi:hypothetical protein D3C76_1089600 [compost metagenome]